MKVNLKEKYSKIFLKNFVGGIGWSVGATLGFALFVALIGFVLKQLGGLPFVGNFFANIIEATNKALEAKNFLSQ